MDLKKKSSWIYSAPDPTSDIFVIERRGRFGDREIYRHAWSHIQVEVKIGMMLSQDKECQELQKDERSKEVFFPRTVRGSMTLPTP